MKIFIVTAGSRGDVLLYHRSAALQEVTTNPTIRQNVEALSEKIRAEDGIANATTIIEQVARI